jgi:hypothetical protein
MSGGFAYPFEIAMLAKAGINSKTATSLSFMLEFCHSAGPAEFWSAFILFGFEARPCREKLAVNFQSGFCIVQKYIRGSE